MRKRYLACVVPLLILAAYPIYPAKAGEGIWEARNIATAVKQTASHKLKTTNYVGLRRSSYGLKVKNRDNAWWAVRAKEFAASITGERSTQPVIIQIVSIYLDDDGSTLFEFTRPENYSGSTKNMIFRPGAIDHEKALTTYDQQGVKAILQLEPGNADVSASLEIAHLKFGHHPSIIGYGIDAEWYYTRESIDNTGLHIRDKDARTWMEKVLSFSRDYTLFLKHWDSEHMPPTYRHPNLWFLSDTQNYMTIAQLVGDMKLWNRAHGDQIVGYQIGYKADERWWKKMKRPSVEISQSILKGIPNTRFLFWVDFTLNKISF